MSDQDEVEAAIAEYLAETGNRAQADRYRYLVSDENTSPAPRLAADYRSWLIDRGWRRTIPVDYTPVTGGGCGGCPGVP